MNHVTREALDRLEERKQAYQQAQQRLTEVDHQAQAAREDEDAPAIAPELIEAAEVDALQARGPYLKALTEARCLSHQSALVDAIDNVKQSPAFPAFLECLATYLGTARAVRFRDSLPGDEGETPSLLASLPPRYQDRIRGNDDETVIVRHAMAALCAAGLDLDALPIEPAFIQLEESDAERRSPLRTNTLERKRAAERVRKGRAVSA